MRIEGDNVSGLRRSNRAAVLQCLHETEALSRKKLAEQLGLTPAAITKIVAELIDEGLLKEGEAIPGSGAGRREVTLTLNAQAGCALGVFLGLGNVILSGVWLNGDLIFSESIDIPFRAPAEETFRFLAEKLMTLARDNGISAEAVAGIGIAVRGTIGEGSRTVHSSFDALDTEDYPICDRFETLTGLPCVLSNNVRALLTAQNFLDRKGSDGSRFFLRCAHGIGAAFSIDGKIFEGDRRQCSEIGHIPVVRQGGKPCHCGKSGCLETIASPTAIREDAAARLDPNRTPLLWKTAKGKDAENISVFDVLDAARGGDAGAAEVTYHAIETLAAALKCLVYLLDPGNVILYGPIFEHPYYLSRLRAEMEIGVDRPHAVRVEVSRWNGRLEAVAAGLLAADHYLNNGGMRE